MPNHVETDLNVFGPAGDLRRFVEHAQQGEELLTFNAFIAYPSHFRQRDEEVARMHRENDEDRKAGIAPRHKVVPTDGFNSGGYEWCKQNWGTKWDAYEITRDCDAKDITDDVSSDTDECSVSYSFKTAWSAPYPVLLAASRAFPTLTFEAFSYERGMAWMRVHTVKAGQVEIEAKFPYHGNRGG
jgi:hypothetical protein